MMGSAPPDPGTSAVFDLLALISNPEAAKKRLEELKKLRDDTAGKVVELNDKLKKLNDDTEALKAAQKVLVTAQQTHAEETTKQHDKLVQRSMELDQRKAGLDRAAHDLESRHALMNAELVDVGTRKQDVERNEQKLLRALERYKQDRDELDAKMAKMKAALE